MKKLFLMAATMVALTCCACAPGGPAPIGGLSSSAASVAHQAEPATTSAAPAVDYDLSEYKLEGTASGGYSYEATLKIGSWVKASDTDMVNSIWSSIGGTGSAPAIENFTYNNWSSGVHFSEGTSIMAFGTISVDDTTQGGFNLSDSSTSISIAVYSKELNKALLVDSCVAVDSGYKYLHSEEASQAARDVGYVLRVSPKMTGNTWGPQPFVICCKEALSPEHPDGDPEAMNAKWTFGENDFRVYPIWTDNSDLAKSASIATFCEDDWESKDGNTLEFDEEGDVWLSGTFVDEDENNDDYDYEYGGSWKLDDNNVLHITIKELGYEISTTLGDGYESTSFDLSLDSSGKNPETFIKGGYKKNLADSDDDDGEDDADMDDEDEYEDDEE